MEEIEEMEEIITIDAFEETPHPLRKNRYVKVNDSILSEAVAYESYPHLKGFIKSSFNIEPKLKHKVKILPEVEEVKKAIKVLREEIYKKTNIFAVKEPYKKDKQAAIIFNYLIKNLTYDMTTQEERQVNSDKQHRIAQVLAGREKKLNLLVMKPDNKAEEEKQKFKMDKTIVKYNKVAIKNDNESLIKSVYNALKNKKGVCYDYSFAYSFLLNGLGIESYIATLYKEDAENDAGHAINFVKTGNKDKTEFYIVDITQGVGYYKDTGEDKHFICFGYTLDEYGEVMPDRNLMELGKLDILNLRKNKTEFNYLITEEPILKAALDHVVTEMVIPKKERRKVVKHILKAEQKQNQKQNQEIEF